MICLDSWVWLEYLFRGDAWREAEAAIREANSDGVGGIVPATVVAEVAYRIRRKNGATTAEMALEGIRGLENVEILSVTGEVAEFGASLREKYYERGACELSYCDAIHLATAASVSECDTLYTGDPDFANVDEVDTVVL